MRARAERGEAALALPFGSAHGHGTVSLFEMLHPVDANYVNPKLKPNDLSCVLRGKQCRRKCVVDGRHRGAHRGGSYPPRADRGCVPICWSSRTTAAGRSSTPAFIASVRPEVAAFTPGYRNRFNHPRPEIVERYVAAGVRNYRTDYDGALTFTFAEGSSRVPRRERAHDARYWRDAPRGRRARAARLGPAAGSCACHGLSIDGAYCWR